MTRQAVPIYPPHEIDFGSILQIDCRFSIRVEPDGVPSEAVLVESPFCKDSYAEPAQEAALRVRYERTAETVVTFLVYKFRVSGFAERLSTEGLKRIMDAHREVPEDLAFCRMAFSIHPDGAVSGLRTSDRERCLVLPTLAKLPPRLARIAEGQSVLCEWSFEVGEDGPRKLSLSKPCSNAHKRWSRRIVEDWTWNSPTAGTPWPYRVTVRFAPDRVGNAEE